jgi:hypothetical protein
MPNYRLLDCERPKLFGAGATIVARVNRFGSQTPEQIGMAILGRRMNPALCQDVEAIVDRLNLPIRKVVDEIEPTTSTTPSKAKVKKETIRTVRYLPAKAKVAPKFQPSNEPTLKVQVDPRLATWQREEWETLRITAREAQIKRSEEWAKALKDADQPKPKRGRPPKAKAPKLPPFELRAWCLIKNRGNTSIAALVATLGPEVIEVLPRLPGVDLVEDRAIYRGVA